MVPTHYEVLGVATTASPEESAQTILAFLLNSEALTLNSVRRAYKQKALQTHPDKCIDEKAKHAAQAMFCRVGPFIQVVAFNG
jgi:curved DNA-binding protein CbpA